MQDELRSGGVRVTWFLLIIGLVLLAIGLAAGQARPAKRSKESAVRAGQTVDEAWEIITQPVTREEELIKIPAQRAWYRIDRGNKFQHGLLTGLGAGLLVAAAVSVAMPRPEAAPPRDEVAKEQPPAPAPVPVPVEPVAPKPEPPPPVAANITFSVEPGELPPTIAERLKEKGLIEDENVFLRRLEERRVDVLLKAGTFVIPTQATLDQVIDALTA